jgi:hypothetical protein
MADEYITGGEFGRFRADFTAWRAEIAKQMTDGFAGVHSRLDDINGRGRKNSEDIRVMEAELHNLVENGCAQYNDHRKLLDDVVVPAVSRPKVLWENWHPAAKVGAGAGGFVGLATFIELFDRLLKHWGI